ncbi:hypothetical protein O1L55_07145 [Streptomyces albulus]|nr:hypothetical protein [Streptomyces noursei]
MITNVSVHRRANAFAQALEEQELKGAATEDQVDSPAQTPADAGLLAVADGLGELPKPEMAAEVKTVQRAQLIAAMEAAFAEGARPATPGCPSNAKRRRAPRHEITRPAAPALPALQGLAAGGLTVGVAAGAFSGVAMASTDALPGDSSTASSGAWRTSSSPWRATTPTAAGSTSTRRPPGCWRPAA